MERETSPETTHDLLLSLAGRVDDDLLAWARELVAVGEDAHAVEILTASLMAAQTVLPPQVRAALVAAARSARTDLDPGATLPPSRQGDTSEHLFEPGPADDVVAAALLAVPARQLQGCRVLVAHRLTPAGSAPGPLPHPVVLVEVQPGARATDVLAYQLAVILERAGVPSSIEVLTAGTPVPEYHAAALRRARPIRWDAEAERGAGRPDRVAERPPSEHRLAERPLPERPLAERPVGERPLPERPVSERPLPERPGTERPVAGRPQPERPVAGGPAPAAAPEAAPPLPNRRPSRHPLAAPQPDVAGLLGSPLRPPVAPADPRPAPPARPLPHRVPAAATEPVEPSEAGTEAMPAVPPRDTPPPVVPAAEQATPPADGNPPSVESRDEDRPRPSAGPSAPGRPDPAPGPDPIARPRPTAALDGRPTLNAPIPLERRDAATPPVHPAGAVGERAAEPPVAGPPPEQVRRPAEPVEPPRPPHGDARNGDLSRELGRTPAFDALNDPLSGPLREPLLAPLLDPTIDDDPPVATAISAPRDVDTTDVGTAESDTAAGKTADGDAAHSDTAENDPAAGDSADSGDPADSGAMSGVPMDSNAVDGDPAPAADEDDWTAEWLSGSWAMAPSALAEDTNASEDASTDDASAEAMPPVEPDRRGPRPAPRRTPRHRSAEESADRGSAPEPAAEPGREQAEEPGPAPESAPAAEARPAAEPEPVPGAAELGLRPESLARLSDEDRQLLARLQAELSEGRRPRVTRRAGIANGSGPNGSSSNGSGTNGTPRADPPDLAG